MCTLTVLRNKRGLVVTSNRDELRSRSEAGINQELSGATQRIYPVDAQAKGTWVGVNDFGVVASLLNMYESSYQGKLSRGLIIPRLLEFQCLEDAREWLNNVLQPDLYSAFVLLLMDKDDLYRYRWDGIALTEELIEFSNYFLESSSSVDLEETIAHRQHIFKEWQSQDGRDEGILAFHCKRETDNATKSVCMAREHSHTKSISQIAVNSMNVYFRYLSPENLDEAINTHINANQLETVRCELLTPSESDAGLEKVCVG